MQGGQIRTALGRGKARKALWRNWGWSPTQRDMSSSSTEGKGEFKSLGVAKREWTEGARWEG